MNSKELIMELDGIGCDASSAVSKMMDNDRFYIKYLLEFTETVDAGRVSALVQIGKASDVESEVHSIKGMALNLGLLPIVDITTDMLYDIRCNNLLSKTYNRIPQLEVELKKVKNLCEIYKATN